MPSPCLPCDLLLSFSTKFIFWNIKNLNKSSLGDALCCFSHRIFFPISITWILGENKVNGSAFIWNWRNRGQTLLFPLASQNTKPMAGSSLGLVFSLLMKHTLKLHNSSNSPYLILVLNAFSQRKANIEEVKINNSKNMAQDREHAWWLTSVPAGEAKFDGLTRSIHKPPL